MSEETIRIITGAIFVVVISCIFLFFDENSLRFTCCKKKPIINLERFEDKEGKIYYIGDFVTTEDNPHLVRKIVRIYRLRHTNYTFIDLKHNESSMSRTIIGELVKMK